MNNFSGKAALARVLRENGASVDAANYNKWTPLFEACTKGNEHK